MDIQLRPYVQIPFQYFHQCSSKIQEKWREKFAPFFKNLQQSLASHSFFKRSVILPNTPNETAIKANELAGKTLQSEPTIKSTEVKTINDLEILPLDPKTIVKRLDNGLTYYIRDNAYPSKETASLRLIIRAGSTDEEEHEQGIAHFLEHLLFQGTENYGKQDIKRFFESKGAAFGADQNAHTSYNETVYKFDIPLNDPELMDKALHILREMSTRAIIADQTVEEERAVILDEIASESATQRYYRKCSAALLEGTPYPHRRPDGLEEVVRKCTPDQIRAFYKRTYLPQNMALVAVGDFDKKQVDELIQKHFNDIPLSSAPPIKHDFRPNEKKEPQFVCYSDPECTSSQINITYPLITETLAKKETVGNIRQLMTHSLYQLMLNRRLQEIITDSDSSPFTDAGTEKYELVDNLFFYGAFLKANDKDIPAAYKRMLLELKRVQEHGFLPEELESAKKSYQSYLGYQELEKNKIPNKSLAEAYVSHFTNGSPYVDQAKIIDLKKVLVESIKLEHVNSWNRLLTLSKAPLISSFLPASLTENVNPEIFKKISEEVAKEVTAPYIHSAIDRGLLRQIPKPGNIVETITFEKVGVTQWTLENGMRVYLRPSKQKEDSILLFASATGGKLSTPFEKRAAADMALNLSSKSGGAGLTPAQHKKVLADKTIGRNFGIKDYTTSSFVFSSKKDLETAFQLFYNTYADRTFRQEAFSAVLEKKLNTVKHRHKDPKKLFDSVKNALQTQNHPHFLPITAEEYEQAKYQDAVDFWDGQFQNIGNFDLVITGNVDLEATKYLVEKYLAGIPGQRNKLDFTSHKYPGYEFPNGILQKELEAGVKSPCQTHLTFPAPAEDTFESRNFANWTARLLTMHLIDQLRFVKAENYSVGCHYAASDLPGQEKTDPSTMELRISGLPENIHRLNEIVLKEIEKVKNEGFSKEEVATYRTQAKEMYRKALDLDTTWVSLIANTALWGWDMNTIVENYNQLLERFDEKVAQEQLKKLFPSDRYVQVTLFPERLSEPQPVVSDA